MTLDSKPQFSTARNVKLTRREQQVAELLAQGLCNKDVAVQLRLTYGTVKIYIGRLAGKLGVNYRHGIAMWWLNLKNREIIETLEKELAECRRRLEEDR